jgi:hypothetical protein
MSVTQYRPGNRARNQLFEYRDMDSCQQPATLVIQSRQAGTGHLPGIQRNGPTKKGRRIRRTPGDPHFAIEFLMIMYYTIIRYRYMLLNRPSPPSDHRASNSNVSLQARLGYPSKILGTSHASDWDIPVENWDIPWDDSPKVFVCWDEPGIGPPLLEIG